MNSNEPVAWLTRDDGDGLWYSTNFKKSDDDKPLFTSPPKREWVGLTDDEATAVYAETEGKVNEHWNNGGTAMMFPPALYKAIEAKLKEKNA
jgi:hypothetical protein